MHTVQVQFIYTRSEVSENGRTFYATRYCKMPKGEKMAEKYITSGIKFTKIRPGEYFWTTLGGGGGGGRTNMPPVVAGSIKV
jgi:hypothetical protein